MHRSDIGAVVTDHRLNAVASWLVVAFLALVVAESLLDGDLLWAAFTTVLAALAVVPPVAYRDPRVTLPWEVLVLAALPVIGRSFATLPLTNALATYLSVAAVALLVAVELHTFTRVRMSPGFAVLFVAVATMATAGVWAVARWAADLGLGTAYLLDPALTEAEIHTGLMWEFTYSTAAGLAAGGIFEGYFRRHARVGARTPAETDDGTVPDGAADPTGGATASPTDEGSPPDGRAAADGDRDPATPDDDEGGEH